MLESQPQPQPQPQPPLPHRFREESFRRYEPIIAAIVSAHPEICTFNTVTYNLSPVTFSCRLRDAMKSFATYQWASCINFERFIKIHHDIVVSESRDVGIVRVGGKSKIKPIKSITLTKQSPLTAALHIPTDTIILGTTAEAQLLAVLAANRSLAHPIRVTGISPQDVKELPIKFDCSIEQHHDGTFTII